MEKENPSNEPVDMAVASRIAYLIAGFIRHTLSDKEEDELDDWVNASDRNMELFEDLTDERNLDTSLQWCDKQSTEQSLQATKKKLSFNRLQSRAWQYAVILTIFIGGIILTYYYAIAKKDNDMTNYNGVDMMPGSDHATLTLDDGRVIVLDNRENDTIITPQIKISTGEIDYPMSAAIPAVFHTLTTERKGEYKLVLPDNTKVWLNAESSLRYPTAFTGHERKVWLKGEAYFEVAQDTVKPFRVEANEMEVEALGTQFNVHAYSNETPMTTTLVEGSIKVQNSKSGVTVRPGEQARMLNGKLDIVPVQMTDIVAWKNGDFKFTNASIQTIMAQVERWYDAEVIYKEVIPYHFNVTISRSVPVSRLLHLLEETKQVKFTIEGKRIVVEKE